MEKKVSADTVTQLTIDHAFAAATPGNPPSVEKLLADIRADLTQRIKNLANSMENEPEETRSAFRLSHDRDVSRLKRLDDIINNLPKGFRLVPVYYSKITQEENGRTLKNYAGIRPDFMRYLASNHAAELTALGIDQKGLARMKMGDNPVGGKIAGYNVDHIIERAGGGKASLTKKKDPLLPPGEGATYLVNHFNNFIFLPEQIHNIKNELNEMQRVSRLTPGDGKWVVMIVPEAVPGHSGFVAQPQGNWKDNKPPRITYKAPDNPLHSAAKGVKRITNVFNNPNHDPDIESPLLEVLSVDLQAAFNKASHTPQALESFMLFYKSKRMYDLRTTIETMPPMGGVVQMEKALESIDTSLQNRFKKAAANNNTPAPAQNNTYQIKKQKKRLSKAQKRQQRRQQRRLKKQAKAANPS